MESLKVRESERGDENPSGMSYAGILHFDKLLKLLVDFQNMN